MLNKKNKITCCYKVKLLQGAAISRFEISASAIGFDLNTRLLRPGFGRIDMSCAHAHAVSSQWPLSVYEVLVAYRF